MKKTLIMVVMLGTLSVLFATSSNAVAADIQGSAAAAENKVAICIDCHATPDYKASFLEAYRIPYLGGQNAKCIENVLHAYQEDNRRRPTICVIARPLADQDIVNPAAYYAVQTPVAQNNPQK